LSNYVYHPEVKNLAISIINNCPVPTEYSDFFFRDGIYCEFNPSNNDFVCCWCFDKEQQYFWLGEGKHWTKYENVEADNIAQHLLSTIPSLSTSGKSTQGYGMITETLFKIKADKFSNSNNPKN
jgi:hypothetical protein